MQTTIKPLSFMPDDVTQAANNLLSRHRRQIAEAVARSRGQELSAPESKEESIFDKKMSNKTEPGLGSFLQRSSSKNMKQAVSTTTANAKNKLDDAQSQCDATMISSAELTTDTADSENEHVGQQVNAAIQAQQGHIQALQMEVDAQQELSQIRYMSRDKVGATEAMRQARFLQGALAQEEVYYKKMVHLQPDSDGNFPPDALETLQQLMANASSARAHFQQSKSAVKMGDDLLLKEIRRSITKL